MNRAATFAFKNFIVLCITLFTFASVSFSQPMVAVSPKGNPPTTTVLVSGSGFSAYAAIDIYFDATDEALALAKGSGSFSNIEIVIPASALPGRHWVSAVQRSSDTGAQTPFTVNTNWAELGFTPNGKRSNPYENVLSPTTVSAIDEQWSFNFGGTPATVANGVVYFAAGNPSNVYALNANTGAMLGSIATVGEVASTPAVANGLVYVGTGNNIDALDARTGAFVWGIGTGGLVESSPAVANGVVYVGADDNNVYAINAATAFHLTFLTGGPVVSSPAVADGVVYVGSGDNNVYALNATNLAYLWGFPTGGEVYGSPAVADGVVYVGSGDNNVYALNAATGYELWNYNVFAPVYSSPAVANGIVYIGSGNQILYALNAATGALLWYFPGPSQDLEGSINSPAVANGVVYISTSNGYLYALNATTGAQLWNFNTGFIIGSPVVVNGVVYVSGPFGVYAFSEQGGLAFTSLRRPALNSLHPDPNLKVSKPVAKLPNSDYKD
jgi:outer membrane protein assembly factor BamB